MSLGGSVRESVGIVRKFRVHVEDRSSGSDVIVIGQHVKGLSGSVGTEKIQHFEVLIRDDTTQGVAGAFNHDIGTGAVLEQSFGHLVMAVGSGQVKRLTLWRDAFFRKIGIGPMVQEYLNDSHMARPRRIPDRGT